MINVSSTSLLYEINPQTNTLRTRENYKIQLWEDKNGTFQIQQGVNLMSTFKGSCR